MSALLLLSASMAACGDLRPVSCREHFLLVCFYFHESSIWPSLGGHVVTNAVDCERAWLYEVSYWVTWRRVTLQHDNNGVNDAPRADGNLTPWCSWNAHRRARLHLLNAFHLSTASSRRAAATSIRSPWRPVTPEGSGYMRTLRTTLFHGLRSAEVYGFVESPLDVGQRKYESMNWLTLTLLFMSPLRRHIFVCFITKSAFWSGFSALAPYTGVGPK